MGNYIVHYTDLTIAVDWDAKAQINQSINQQNKLFNSRIMHEIMA